MDGPRPGWEEHLRLAEDEIAAAERDVSRKCRGWATWDRLRSRKMTVFSRLRLAFYDRVRTLGPEADREPFRIEALFPFGGAFSRAECLGIYIGPGRWPYSRAVSAEGMIRAMRDALDYARTACAAG